MQTNFELVTELQGLLRRDFSVADRTLVDPTNANPILDGEFLFVDNTYKLVRATAGTAAWVCFMERGRFDVQSIGKLTVLMGPTYEADTKIMNPASITTGCQLSVGNVTYGGQTRSGLVLQASTALVIGYCTRIPTNNGGKLRFVQTLF